MDALLVHGHWRVVGHRDVDEGAIPWPAYKVGVSPPGAYEVIDYTGNRRRAASDEEVERLQFREVVAPIRVEKALRALHGQDPWVDDYEALRPVGDGETSAALLS